MRGGGEGEEENSEEYCEVEGNCEMEEENCEREDENCEKKDC